MRRLLSAALVVAAATVAACIHGPVVAYPVAPAAGSGSAVTAKYGDSILHGGLHFVTTNSPGLLAGSGTSSSPLTATIHVDGTTITGTGSAGSPLVGAAAGVTGTGTSGKVTRFTGTSAVGNASASDDGTTMTTEALAATPDSETILGGSVEIPYASTATLVRLTCHAGGDSALMGLAAPATTKRLYVEIVGSANCSLVNEDGAETTLANRVDTPGSANYVLEPGDGFQAEYDVTLSRWEVQSFARHHPVASCGTGNHVSAIDATGSATCTADAPANGITGTLTSPDLVVANGTNSVTNYAGSTCAGSTVATAISASGGLTCGITPLTGTLTSGKVPVATGTSTEGDSIISATSSAVSINNSAASFQLELLDGTSGSLSLVDANATPAIGFNSHFNGTAWVADATSFSDLVATGVSYRFQKASGCTIGSTCTTSDVVVINTSGSPILKVTGDTETTGQLTVDTNATVKGNTTLGTATTNTVVADGPLTSLHSGGNSGTPTVTSCGTSPTITGNDTGGLITVGTGTVTSCQINFATPYTQIDDCVFMPSTAGTVPSLYINGLTTAHVVVDSVSAGNMAGDAWYYHCDGH